MGRIFTKRMRPISNYTRMKNKSGKKIKTAPTQTPKIEIALEKGKLVWPAILLMASGMVALIFQVLWIKQLTLIVGVDVFAVTTGVSAFFAGLAFGGLFFGRIADRVKRPLLLYVKLELGIALVGIIITYLLPKSAALFANLEVYNSLLAWSLVFLMVTVGPFLMGGTLPAVVRSLSLSDTKVGSGGGNMYAANTLGAILGAIVCSFVLIPSFGIQGSALFASSIGLCAALIGYYRNKSKTDLTSSETEPSQNSFTKSAGIAILLYAISGGLALGYEVVWSQSMVQFMSTRSFAFSVMLATYLAGLAIGSALISRRVDKLKNPWGLFGLLIAAAGCVSLIEITLLGDWLTSIQSSADRFVYSLTESRLAAMCARFSIAAMYIVFIPTLFLGAAFPVALKLIVNSSHIGRDLGKVVALNTLGGITGTIITGFILVPQFGVVKTLAILAVIACSIGIIAVFKSKLGGFQSAKKSILVLTTVTLLAAIYTPKDKLAELLVTNRGGKKVYYEEGRGGTVAVLEQKAGTKSFRRLYIQGVSNTGDAMPSLRYMRLQALIPLIIHNGKPESALVIGLGTGITSGSLLTYPGLKKRVVAEILPEVVEASSIFEGNFGASSDPKLDIRLRDGRRELLSNDSKYDLITLEPPPPSAAGVVNLYSTNFYQIAKSRLKSGGIVAQWLPLPTQNDEDTRSLVKSFLDVFPYTSLWTTELHEMLLIGSLEPIVLNGPKIIEQFKSPKLADALKEIGIDSPESLMATYVMNRKGLEKYAGNALPVTDNQPRIEYSDWVRTDEIHRVLPELMMLRTNPPIEGVNQEFLSNVESERNRLMLFYQAALNGSMGYKEQWATDMQIVLKGDGNNAYFRWFGGDLD